MRLILGVKVLICVLLFTSSIHAALLTGQTPDTYSLPSGWSEVITQDFESGGIGPNEELIGAVTSVRAHTGTKSTRGYYSADAAEARWMLSRNVIGTYTEVYLSFYEWVDSNARNSDEMFVANFVKNTEAEWYLIQEVITEWFAGPGQGWNGTEGYILIQHDGDVSAGGTEAIVHYGPTKTWPVGSWVQWEVHYRPNTPGNSDGFIRVYKDGERWLNVNNQNLNGTVDMSNVMIQAGGVYTKLGWQISENNNGCATGEYPGGEGAVDYHFYPPGEWYTNRVVDFDYCRWPMGDGSYTTCNNQCPPDGKVPKFYRYFDDIIVLKTAGAPETDPPPYASQWSPAKNATGVPVTNRTISFHIRDNVDVLTANGVVNIEGANYTCGSGITCVGGGTTDVTVTYTKGSDWSNDQVVNVSTSGFRDTAGYIMVTDTWSFTTASSPPTGLNITTTTLDNAIIGTPYNEQLTATGGTSPYTWSIGSTPYDPGYPYAPSSHIINLTWDHANVLTLAPGSDLWPMTWAGDDNVYAIGGDGGGFNGTNTICRARTQFARITGTPPSLTGTNISGCKSDDTGCDGVPPHDAACDAPYQASATNEVPNSILAIDNTIYTYGWTFTTPARSTMRTSSNFGQTWSAPSGMYWEYSTGQPFFSTFVQFGAGYSGARDTYVYVLGSKPGTVGTYLARVPKASITTKASYEYFSGTSSSPAWSSTWADATQIFSDNNGNMNGMNMSYLPVLGKYIATIAHGVASDDSTDTQKQALGVFEGPEPWGPWKTVYYSDTWGNYGTKHGLNNTISTKWLSGDNKTFYMVFSGPDYDNFNLIKGTFTLASPQLLPPGLSLASTGSITGIPILPTGTTNFTVTATDSASPPATDNQALSITVLAATPGGQTTKEIPIDQGSLQDTWINSGDGDTNWSTSTTLKTYQYPNNTTANRILDNIVMGLPDNVSILSATYKAYMVGYDDSGGTDPMPLYIYRVANMPNLSTVTWNNFSGTLQTYESITGVTKDSGWVSWDVTNAARWAYANSSPLYIAIDGGTASDVDTNRTFASRDHLSGEVTVGGLRPYLSITYMSLTPEGVTISAPGKMRVSKLKGRVK
jgi:hypothetical protein